MWLFTYLTPYHLIPFDVAKEAIDLNVIVLLAAMMSLVGVLKTTGVLFLGGGPAAPDFRWSAGSDRCPDDLVYRGAVECCRQRDHRYIRNADGT